jgi:imidazolonepropionase-like amidohydrolase
MVKNLILKARNISKSSKMASILLKNCAEVVYSKDGREKVGSEMAVVDVLTDSDVLIVDGKFKQIGKGLQAPEGVTVMDCSGKSG